MDEYRRQLREALVRSEKWDVGTSLESELLHLYLDRGQPAGVTLTRHHLVEFSRTAWIPIEERGGSCLQVHVSVAEHLMQEGFPAPPVLTIGDVEIDGARRYRVTRQGLRSLIREGRRGRGTIHVHAWLTFPDMTILDMSLLPALLNEGNERLQARADGITVAGRPDELEFKYVPMLIGMEFVWRTAAMVRDESRVRAVATRWRAAGGVESLRSRYDSGWESPRR